MHPRTGLWAIYAVSLTALAVLAGCTTSVPAPVVDRATRPTVATPDPRSLPPAPVSVVPINPNQPGNTPGSQFHVVQRGETLYGIARANGVDLNALTALNSISASVPLREGQVLRLPQPIGAAGAQPLAGQPPIGPATGITVTPIPATGVIQGQPLPGSMPPAVVGGPSLSPIPSVATGAPGALPTVVPVEAPLKRDPKSQRLPYSDSAFAILQRGEVAPPAVASVTPATPVTGNDVRALPPTTVPAAPVVEPATSASAPSSAAAVDVEIKPGSGVDRDGITWTWPTSGKVASKFNEKAPMKGIDIAANSGTSVVAAATGKVIYVGKEPRGYGQMIVINHAKETVSVYFHTDKVLVKEQQRVLLGQKLAEVADTAGNKMHFEVRRQGRPLDPIALMPK
jgi:lipoprotein NlpD